MKRGDRPNLPNENQKPVAASLSSHDPTQAASPPTEGAEPKSDETQPPQESPWVFWRGVLITLGLALGVRHYILEARYIPSGSMLPGLQLQDRLLVEKLSLRSRSPERGEIVVFNGPARWHPIRSIGQKSDFLHCLPTNIPIVSQFLDEQKYQACHAYIKRVIAKAGDRVDVSPTGRVRINGIRINEPYVKNYCATDSLGNGFCAPFSGVVPSNQIFVLGDNRASSLDSRYWGFLPEKEIIGRAFWRWWPLSTSGALTSRDPLKNSGAKAGG